MLVGLYALFALSAGARAGVQIATQFHEAPLAYLLSALAAAIYLVATIGLIRGGRGGRRLAMVCCSVELVGVLAVGTVSLVDPSAFPHATVWSGFGRGYGFVPLVLPVLGLLWLRATPASPEREGDVKGPGHLLTLDLHEGPLFSTECEPEVAEVERAAHRGRRGVGGRGPGPVAQRLAGGDPGGRVGRRAQAGQDHRPHLGQPLGHVDVAVARPGTGRRSGRSR